MTVRVVLEKRKEHKRICIGVKFGGLQNCPNAQWLKIYGVLWEVLALCRDIVSENGRYSSVTTKADSRH